MSRSHIEGRSRGWHLSASGTPAFHGHPARGACRGAGGGIFRGPGGFTLIELLIVVVIIAILASIAIFHVYEGKRRAQVAAVRQDLKNLVSAQEAYFTDSQVYAADLSYLSGMYRTTDGVTVTLDSASATGWGAKGTHDATDDECEVSVSKGATGIVSCT